MNVSLYMSLLAFAKSYSLVSHLEDEVIWLGKVSLLKWPENIFIVEDIYVPPQEVTRSAASIRSEEYNAWVNSLEFCQNDIRYYAHFHPNGVMEPSVIDGKLYNAVKQWLPNYGAAIFSVWGPDGKSQNIIYDIDEDIEYFNDDIELVIYGENFISKNFIQDAKKLQNNTTECLNKHMF